MAALRGLAAGLGYDIYSPGSLPVLDRRPSFIGLVGGEENEIDQVQLEALEDRGLVIGPNVESVAPLSTSNPTITPTPSSGTLGSRVQGSRSARWPTRTT